MWEPEGKILCGVPHIWTLIIGRALCLQPQAISFLPEDSKKHVNDQLINFTVNQREAMAPERMWDLKNSSSKESVWNRKRWSQVEKLFMDKTQTTLSCSCWADPYWSSSTFAKLHKLENRVKEEMVNNWIAWLGVEETRVTQQRFRPGKGILPIAMTSGPLTPLKCATCFSLTAVCESF